MADDRDGGSDVAADVAAVRAADKAERDRSMIAQGRRIGGVPGAALAGAMIALRDIYEGPKRDEMVAVSEHPGEPHDVDSDGMDLAADDVGGEVAVFAPPQPRRPPVVAERRRSRRR